MYLVVFITRNIMLLIKNIKQFNWALKKLVLFIEKLTMATS